MDSEIRERVERWEADTTGDALAELRSLAAASVSGAVAADSTWVFLLNGRVIGEVGDVEDLEGRDGTVYTAPDPAVPLLAAMRAQGGTAQARYYSEETPLTEVDETLSEAGFTGYVELSEGVLSGDYYAVYYGGKRMAAAYVGTADRLLTGEEAFERAADEVGIYEVVSVDVTVTDVPPEETSAAGDPVSPPATDPTPGDQVATPTPDPDEQLEQSTQASDAAGSHVTATTDTEDETDRDAVAGGDDSGPFEEEERWRESRSIPSIDTAEADDYGTVDDAFDESVLEQEDRIDQLTQQVRELDVRREVLEEENDALTAERNQLAAAVERLEARVDELETQLDAVEGGEDPELEATGRSLSSEAALAGTNVFIRYRSKGDPTLEAVPDGAERAAVVENRRLEYHTEFDAAEVHVEGATYPEFLAGTMAWRFVDWLTGTAPFEIRETGAAPGLADVYEAIPRIDRVGFEASVDLDGTDEELPEAVTFDIVAFDKMGAPLVVATLNDSRDPASRERLEELEAAASAVKASHDDLAAAVAVTASFFEPGALEVASEATGGGFLSRNSRRSYVTVSRKSGYHLCLVEARQGGLHLVVPEL